MIWQYEDVDLCVLRGSNVQRNALHVLITKYVFICGMIEQSSA